MPLIYRCFFALFLAFASLCAFASDASSVFAEANTVHLRADQQKYLLGKSLMYLEDRDGTKTFDDILGHPDAFVQGERDVLNFDATSSVYWLKVRLHRTGDAPERWFLEMADAMFQYLDIWVVDDHHRIGHIVTGSLRPRSRDMLDVRGHVMDLSVPSGGWVDVYVRGATGYVQLYPLTLWQPDAFYQQRSSESVLHGAYIGIALAMLLYNFLMYRTIREKSYGHYVGYLAATVCVECLLNGIMSYYLMEEFPVLANQLFVVCYCLVGFFTIGFSINFLNLSERQRKIFFMLFLSFFVSILAWLIAGYIAWTITYQFFMMVGTCGALFVGVRQAMRGDKPAILYVAGFGWFLLSAIVFLMTCKDIIPFTSVTFYAVEIGSAMEAMLLSLAMAQRVKLMKEEKEQAQAAEVEAQKASLHDKQALIDTVQQYNANLEAEVKARTAELMDTQQKLVATEKMAALGIFTAGMAHEINNPANFVSVSVQNASAQLAEFRDFVSDLLAEDPDPDIVDAFELRFSKLENSHATASEGVARIEHVVRQLRADHPEGDTGMQAADVVATLESAWAVIHPTFKVPVELVIDLQARPTVPCMIAEVNQVFLALMSNAGHAIEDAVATNGPDYKGQITLASREVDGHLVITIADNGRGIPAGNIDKVFDPFFTTKTVGRGAGLGLSMARDVVRKHGGTVEVESKLGKGTVMVVRLPVKNVD